MSNRDDEIKKLFKVADNDDDAFARNALEKWTAFQNGMRSAEERMIGVKTLSHIKIALFYFCLFSLLMIGFAIIIDEWILALWGIIQGLIALFSLAGISADKNKEK